MTQSLLLLFFCMPVATFATLASAPPWLLDAFVYLGLVEDCTDHPQTCRCEMCRHRPDIPRPRQGGRHK